jgi:hypothetical protein
MKEDWERKIADLKKKYGPLDFFSVDEHGRAIDSHIHEPILAAGDHERAREAGRRWALSAGIRQDIVDRIYGKRDSEESR